MEGELIVSFFFFLKTVKFDYPIRYVLFEYPSLLKTTMYSRTKIKPLLKCN